jgi:hypothetical protein
MRKVRKISKTEKGSLLVNLREFLPEHWSYIEIDKVNESAKTVTLKFTVLAFEQPEEQEVKQPTPQAK